MGSPIKKEATLLAHAGDVSTWMRALQGSWKTIYSDMQNCACVDAMHKIDATVASQLSVSRKPNHAVAFFTYLCGFLFLHTNKNCCLNTCLEHQSLAPSAIHALEHIGTFSFRLWNNELPTSHPCTRGALWASYNNSLTAAYTAFILQMRFGTFHRFYEPQCPNLRVSLPRCDNPLLGVKASKLSIGPSREQTCCALAAAEMRCCHVVVQQAAVCAAVLGCCSCYYAVHAYGGGASGLIDFWKERRWRRE